MFAHSYFAANFFAPNYFSPAVAVAVVEPEATLATSGVGGPGRRRWAVKKDGDTYFFDDVNDIEDFLKEEPGKRTVVREEGKKTVVLKSRHKLPEVEKLVNEWKLEAPQVQIALPTVDLLAAPIRTNDVNLTPRKRDTDEEDFVEFLSIL